MLIDCDTCTLRGVGCADCVVTVVLGVPAVPPSRRVVPLPPERLGAVVEFDDVEHRAVNALADFGLVPPLRHQVAPGTRRNEIDGHDRDVS